MKPGEKVIYTHTGGLDDGRPQIGFLVAKLDSHQVSAVGETVDADVDDCEIIHNARIHPYTEALWAAWQQWLRNAKALEEQQRQLCAGRTPADLVTIGMW